MITVLIDIATRVVPGWYVSLEHPSVTSVGMAIRRAVLPKEDVFHELGVEAELPCWGVPDWFHLDNVGEFHSQALTRVCQQYGIDIQYRPRGKPHYGGHVERLIGTLVGEMHLLPGTTFSSVAEKGDYDAEGRACMTLKEFERWLVL